MSSFTGDSVEKFDQNGVFVETFIDSDLVGPTNIWFEDNGDLIVIDYNGGSVKRFDSDGNFLGIFIDGISFAEGVDFLPNDDILIGDGNNSAVNRYASDGTFIEVFIESGAGDLLTPNAIVRREIPLAVDENPIANSKVTPTVGTLFTIEIDDTSILDTITVYNILGQRMDTLNLQNTTLQWNACLLYTSPSPRDQRGSRMPSSA